MAFQEKVKTDIWAMFGNGGEMAVFDISEEVQSIEQADLDDSVFEIPAGYREY